MKRHTILLALAAVAGACGEPAADLSAPHTLGTPGGRTSILAPNDGIQVMSNLLSPRGLAWGPDGSLYVAEAGRGGPSAPGKCFVQFNATFCYGNTGAVSRLRNGVQQRIVDNLPSYAQVTSGQGEGPNGISIDANSNAYVGIGLEGNPITLRAAVPEMRQMARLVRIEPAVLTNAPRSGPPWQFVADLGQYEIDVNPDCGDIDSNPFGVLAEFDGVTIMDAGANAIVRRSPFGALSTVAAFTNNTTVPGAGCPPEGTRDFVPTAIAIGPDGAYYFGHLNGLPVSQGSSKIYRMERGGTPQVFLENFTWIVAIAFDTNGNLYVLQFTDGPLQTSGGSVTRIAPDGTRETLVGGLQRATGLAIGADGAVYVSMIQGQNYRQPGEVRKYVFP